MEFPFGHHHHGHHNRREEDSEEGYGERPPPPPPASEVYEETQDLPPPPPPHHHHYWGRSEEEQQDEYSYEQPPRRPGHYGGQEVEEYQEVEPPPRRHAWEENEGGEGGRRGEGYEHGGHRHHEERYDQQGFSSVTHVSHETAEGGEWARQPTMRIYPKAGENYSLTIREGNVVLARSDPSDEYQHWIKDLRYSTRVKDEEGFPAFSLVNKVTGEAIKHSIGKTHPLRLVDYNPEYLDESVLWSESKDVGDGFRCIRMVNNIGLNFDAFHGDKDHGGVKDGTIIVLWDWCKGDNQMWKIVPY